MQTFLSWIMFKSFQVFGNGHGHSHHPVKKGQSKGAVSPPKVTDNEKKNNVTRCENEPIPLGFYPVRRPFSLTNYQFLSLSPRLVLYLLLLICTFFRMVCHSSESLCSRTATPSPPPRLPLTLLKLLLSRVGWADAGLINLLTSMHVFTNFLFSD